MSGYNCPISRPLDRMRRPLVTCAAAAGKAQHPVPVQLLAADTGNAGVRLTAKPFKPGTSMLFVNGVRYWRDDDYYELAGGEGFALPGLTADDEVVLLALPNE